MEDPSLQKRMDQIAARDWTIPIFAKAVSERGFDELIAAFEPAGIPFSPIHRPAEMYDDPHVTRPGGLMTSTLPEGGSYQAPGLPFEVDGAVMAIDAPHIAAIGADTEAVLGSIGLDPAEIAAASGRSTAA